jgi:hypothetical protein
MAAAPETIPFYLRKLLMSIAAGLPLLLFSFTSESRVYSNSRTPAEVCMQVRDTVPDVIAIAEKPKPQKKEIVLPAKMPRVKIDTRKIYRNPEIEATFRGGDYAWKKYVDKMLNTGIASDNHAPDGTYIVSIQFVVHPGGDISDITALTKHGYGMEEAAMKLLRESPKWNSAIQKGISVKSYKIQSFVFVVPTPS